MCGIIGIASFKDISKEILESLKKLEYRGYDSAGISTIYNGHIVENKCAGKVSDLEELIKKTSLTWQYRDWETDRKSTRLNSSHRL